MRLGVTYTFIIRSVPIPREQFFVISESLMSLTPTSSPMSASPPAMGPAPFDGCFRRLIDLRAWDENTVVGWLEDNYHHFGITLSHDGRIVTGVSIAAVRYPWKTCPAAAEPFRQLIGKPLLRRCTDIGEQLNMRMQCTHIFDLAGLLSVHAFHRRNHHRYHAKVHSINDDKDKTECLLATLMRDEQVVLSWQLHKDVIMAPREHAGYSITKGFRAWTETLDESAAEHASVLRRVVSITPDRPFSERITVIPDGATIPTLCHSFQPENIGNAKRDGDASETHFFEEGAEGMLALVDTKP